MLMQLEEQHRAAAFLFRITLILIGLTVIAALHNRDLSLQALRCIEEVIMMTLALQMDIAHDRSLIMNIDPDILCGRERIIKEDVSNNN